MLTAESLTADQIREYECDELDRFRGVHTSAARKGRWAAIDLATMASSDAIDWSRVRSGEIDAAVANDHNRRRQLARARLAEILNGRLADGLSVPSSSSDEEVAGQIATWLEGLGSDRDARLAAAIRRGEYRKAAAKEPR